MSAMQQFANPARFLKLAQAILAPVWVMATVAVRDGALHVVRYRARRLSAGRNGADHVRPCAGRLDGADGLYRHGGWPARSATIFRHPLADMAAKAAAPIGAMFCLLALITGSLWGKPMWGAWWVWDARLTSMFVLFLLYLGYMAIWQAIEDPHRAALDRPDRRDRRLHQRADRQILGRLVEFAASGRIRAAHGRADHRFTHAVAAAGDGVCLSAALRGPAPRRHAKRDHIAQDPANAVRRGSRDTDGSRRCPCRFCDRSLCGELCGPCGDGVLHPAARPKARSGKRPLSSATGRARHDGCSRRSPRPRRWLAVLPVAIFLVLAALFYPRPFGRSCRGSFGV